MIPFMHRMTSVTTEDNPLWLIVLSDIMTNLMLFFLMLFVLSRMGPEERKQMNEGLQEKFSSKEERRAKQQILIIEKKTEDNLEKSSQDTLILRLQNLQCHHKNKTHTPFSGSLPI